jgi:hypothetical protein
VQVRVAYLVLLDVVNAAELELDTNLELGLDKTLLLIDDEAIKFELRLDEVVLLVDVGIVEVVEVPLVSEVLVVKVEELKLTLFVVEVVLVVRVVLVVEVVLVDVGPIELEVVRPCTKQPPVTEGTALTPVEIGIMFAVTDPVHVAA